MPQAWGEEPREKGLELLPEGRAFRRTIADPREIRLAVLFQGNSRVDAVLGNYFSIFAIKDVVNRSSVFFGMEGAGYFSMRQADSRFPLEQTDGLVGLYLEGAKQDWQWQVRYTHISAHMSDGSVIPPIAFSREYLVGRVGYVPNDYFHLYAGISRLTHTVPSVLPWGAQFGGSYFLPTSFNNLTLFVAWDLRWKEESGKLNPSFAAQTGVAIHNPPNAYRSFRFFYSYYTGSDPRGQFYNRQDTHHMIGIEAQI